MGVRAVARQTKQTEIHKQTYANRNANKQKQTNTHRAHTEREGREEQCREERKGRERGEGGEFNKGRNQQYNT